MKVFAIIGCLLFTGFFYVPLVAVDQNRDNFEYIPKAHVDMILEIANYKFLPFSSYIQSYIHYSVENKKPWIANSVFRSFGSETSIAFYSIGETSLGTWMDFRSLQIAFKRFGFYFQETHIQDALMAKNVDYFAFATGQLGENYSEVAVGQFYLNFSEQAKKIKVTICVT